MGVEILHGDCREILPSLAEKSVHCCVTSPPYWGLRDYGVEGQIGLEATPEEYVAKMVKVFREVWRVMRDDGTLWLNLGDSYAGSWGGYKQKDRSKTINAKALKDKDWRPPTSNYHPSLKPKDLIGMPWRVAFALQEDGWFLRQDIIWSKPNPMPESVRDRCTKSHEYIFLLSKSPHYYFDQEAIKEPALYESEKRYERGRSDAHKWKDGGPGNQTIAKSFDHMKKDKQRGHSRRHAGFNDRWDKMTKSEQCSGYRNRRSVWKIATQPYSAAHFATFPEKLIEPCIIAGCPKGGTVLDPFGGSGTTGRVALKNQRNAILIELNEKYLGFQKERTSNVQVKIF